MRKINQFMFFDAEAFFKDKDLIYLTGDIEDKEKFKGARVKLLILRDRTKYKDEVGLNAGEALFVKVEGADQNYLSQFKPLDVVYIENPIVTPWSSNERKILDNISIKGTVKKK